MKDNLQYSIELEKKFIIAYPDLAALQKYAPVRYEIEQIYLQSDLGSHRIRKRKTGDTVQYFETVKVRITGDKCHEYEGEISKEEYENLKAQADPQKHPIVKDRYVFDYAGKSLEVDVFPFWKDKAVLEIELSSDDEPYAVPAQITVLQDVSTDKRYKNNYLASVTDYENY